MALFQYKYNHLHAYITPNNKKTTEITIYNYGCPPTKIAIIVLLTEPRTKNDTFMTTV